MAQVHPSAVVDPAAELAADVVVGPMTVIGPDVRLGAGTEIVGQAWIQGPTTIGANNRILPGARIGFAPQSISYDPTHPGEGLVIGDANIFREGVTVHRAMTDEGPTRIGSNNYFMTNSHVGHDVQLADRCILATGVALGGHVVVADRVNIGGNSVVHQFVRIGEGAMLSGGVGCSLDVPPWFMLTGINVAGSLNLVGMRRSGMAREDIDHVRWIYREAARGHNRENFLAVLRSRADVPFVARYLAWFEAGTRGWCTRRPKAARGT
jgi:UDP-N-acetylglucosamine acyltransferase